MTIPRHHPANVFNYILVFSFPAPHLDPGDDQPTCAPCGLPLTVKHTLVNCPFLQDIQLKHFTISSQKDLFERVNNCDVIDFVKETLFYDQL